MKGDDPNKTYFWLRSRVDAHMTRKAEDKNTATVNTLQQGGISNTHLNPAAPGQASKGGKGKKGKGQGQGSGGGNAGGAGQGKGSPDPNAHPKYANGVQSTTKKGAIMYDKICRPFNFSTCPNGKSCTKAHLQVKADCKDKIPASSKGKGDGGKKGKGKA